MKFKGQKALGPKPEYIVIPRGDDNIVFIAKPILDYSGFDELCPRPVPPGILFPDGRKGQDIESPEYRDKMTTYIQLRTDWYVINALRDTPDCEWEQVQFSVPNSWSLWKNELGEFLTEREINQVLDGISIANGLNQSKIEEAKERFLAGMVSRLNEPSSLLTEEKITQSGEPVNESESVLQMSETVGTTVT